MGSGGLEQGSTLGRRPRANADDPVVHRDHVLASSRTSPWPQARRNLVAVEQEFSDRIQIRVGKFVLGLCLHGVASFCLG
jgi:hypothetical protein